MTHTCVIGWYRVKGHGGVVLGGYFRAVPEGSDVHVLTVTGGVVFVFIELFVLE